MVGIAYFSGRSTGIHLRKSRKAGRKRALHNIGWFGGGLGEGDEAGQGLTRGEDSVQILGRMGKMGKARPGRRCSVLLSASAIPTCPSSRSRSEEPLERSSDRNLPTSTSRWRCAPRAQPRPQIASKLSWHSLHAPSTRLQQHLSAARHPKRIACQALGPLQSTQSTESRARCLFAAAPRAPEVLIRPSQGNDTYGAMRSRAIWQPCCRAKERSSLARSGRTIHTQHICSSRDTCLPSDSHSTIFSPTPNTSPNTALAAAIRSARPSSWTTSSHRHTFPTRLVRSDISIDASQSPRPLPIPI